MSDQDKTFDLDNIPEDATVSTSQAKQFDPIEDDSYQVQITDAVLKQNMFWKEPTEQERKEGKGFDKYVFAFTFVILTDGEVRGRRLWENAGLSLKPTTKKGQPTKLYKIVTKAIKSDLDWDGCASFAPDTRTLYQNILNEVVGRQIRVTTETTKNPDTGKFKTKVVSFAVAKRDLPPYVKQEQEGEDTEDAPAPKSRPSKSQLPPQPKDPLVAEDISDDIPF